MHRQIGVTIRSPRGVNDCSGSLLRTHISSLGVSRRDPRLMKTRARPARLASRLHRSMARFCSAGVPGYSSRDRPRDLGEPC